MRARKIIIKFRVNDDEYKRIWSHVNKIETDISKFVRETCLDEIVRSESVNQKK